MLWISSSIVSETPPDFHREFIQKFLWSSISDSFGFHPVIPGKVLRSSIWNSFEFPPDFPGISPETSPEFLQKRIRSSSRNASAGPQGTPSKYLQKMFQRSCRNFWDQYLRDSLIELLLEYAPRISLWISSRVPLEISSGFPKNVYGVPLKIPPEFLQEFFRQEFVLIFFMDSPEILPEFLKKLLGFHPGIPRITSKKSSTLLQDFLQNSSGISSIVPSGISSEFFKKNSSSFFHQFFRSLCRNSFGGSP